MKKNSNSLENPQQISQIDKSHMAATIAAIPQQLAQAWDELRHWKANIDASNIKNIVTVGMGGSGLGAHLVNSLFGDELNIPHVIVNDYNLPEFVNKNSLVFLISYSGNTQETLEAAKIALSRESKIIVITTSGKLSEFAKNNSFPFWIFEPRFNFCGQPRLGLGYLILGQILLFKALNLIEFSRSDFERILTVTTGACQKFAIKMDTTENLAKSTASEIFGKIPAIFAAQYLQGNAHIMANQINENAKMPAFWFTLPEANHHFLESVKFSLSGKNLVFINLISEFYDNQIKKRFEIGKDLSLQHMVKVIDIQLEAQTPLEECFAMLVLSSWISFYLAVLSGIDPTPISTVDFFKQKLSQ